MCRCRRRERKLSPEPKPPDYLPVFAIMGVIALIPFGIFRFDIASLFAVLSSGLSGAFLFRLLESLPPYIESALIVDHSKDSGGTTFYKIAVAAGRPCKNYTIDQRYSSFDDLRQDLNLTLDGFPPKTWRKPSDKEVLARRQGLDNWLTDVVARTLRSGCKDDLRCLASFLGVPVDKQRTLEIAFKEMLQKYMNPSRNDNRTDSEVVRELAHEGGGKICQEDLVKRLNWSPARAEKVLTHFIVAGTCWVDTQDPKVQRWCWFADSSDF